MTEVKLTQGERTAMAREVRRATKDIERGKDIIEGKLFSDVRFEDVPAVDISDYAWAFARFIFPAQARFQ